MKNSSRIAQVKVLSPDNRTICRHVIPGIPDIIEFLELNISGPGLFHSGIKLTEPCKIIIEIPDYPNPNSYIIEDNDVYIPSV